MIAILSALSAFAAPEPVVPDLDVAHATRINRNWRGLGVGVDNGLWGRSYAQGIKLDIPFGPKVGQFFGARLRGVMALPEGGDGVAPIGLAGVELFGRGPVLNGMLRVYGGGGVWYGGPFAGAEGEPRLAGGGHYGVEVLVAPRVSFAFEVGGQAPVDRQFRDGGASVMGGTTVYFGGLGQGG